MDDEERHEAELWEAIEALQHAYLRGDEIWAAKELERIGALQANIAQDEGSLSPPRRGRVDPTLANGWQAPDPNEVEFTTFGPGYGEAHVIHLGNGEWLLVDSCARDGRLPALDYLRDIGVDIASAVKLIVATHWHDDQMRGISQSVARCRAAAFSCSMALRNAEVLAGIGSRVPGRFGRLTSGVDEVRTIFEYLLSMQGETRRTIRWAVKDRTLYSRSGEVPCRVVALSPSDDAIVGASERIHARLQSSELQRVPEPMGDADAVVLQVEVGDATMLLGSDLVEGLSSDTGWRAVEGSFAAGGRRSEIFKVPHHGSGNAHRERVWTEMLIGKPDAVICPHEIGATYLPTETDLERLCALGRVHLTASVSELESRRGRRGRIDSGNFGRVTLRRRLGERSEWAVAYGGSARSGCAYASMGGRRL